MKTINEILKTKPEVQNSMNTLVIMTMVRESKKKNLFEIALGQSDKWFEIPTSMVINAEEVGINKLNDKLYKVVQLELKNDNEENVWFAYLSLVLNQLETLSFLSKDCSNKNPCCCNKETSTNNNVIYRVGAGTGVRTRSWKWRLACMWNGYSGSWCEENGM